MTTVVISGNPRPDSRTIEVALVLARHLGTENAQSPADTANASGRGVPGEPVRIELSELAPDLLVRPVSERVQAALDQVLAADLLVVATPSYKGSFTGLLKSFLDLLPGGSLAAPAHPVVVAASPAHTVSTTEHLEFVLTELGATVRPGVAALESQLGDPAGYLPPTTPELSQSIPESVEVSR